MWDNGNDFDSEIYDYKNKYIQIADHIINPDIPNHIKKNCGNIGDGFIVLSEIVLSRLIISNYVKLILSF